MNRFYFSAAFPPEFRFGEFQLASQDGVRIYEGQHKTCYENGELMLTSHRLIWHRTSLAQPLCLDLQTIVLVEHEAGAFAKSPKIVLTLDQTRQDQGQGPQSKHATDLIKFSFKEGGEKSFEQKLHEALQQRQWELKPPSQHHHRKAPNAPVKKQLRSGIGGIEKSIQQKTKLTDTQISKAFQDLDKLISMAKPMVALAKNISGKIRDKQGEVSDDETVQFKSYLLSLGIADPVTRDTHGSGQKYFKELAKEVFKILEQPVEDSGGMMTLTDAFCRVNRARGLELLSPEDLLNACRALPSVNLPLELHTFPNSGVVVLRSTTGARLDLVEATVNDLAANGSLTAEELSRTAGISVVLAKERLLATEMVGKACRDDTVEGLRFYPNRFLLET